MSEKIGFWNWIARGIKAIPKERSLKECSCGIIIILFGSIAGIMIDPYAENPLVEIKMLGTLGIIVVGVMIIIHGIYLDMIHNE